MPNPSTIAAELLAQRDRELELYRDLTRPKASREYALAEVRRIEDELDLPQDQRTPAHNGRPAQHTVQGQPLAPLGLNLRQLQDARNELKTISYSEVGAIIHGLRTFVQKGGDGVEDAEQLLARLIR